MSFSSIYTGKQCRFSVEVFPPKTALGVLKLFEEINQLKAINPAFISVTYGAMGSTRDLTQDLAIQIHDSLKVTTAFHFTCIGSSKTEIDSYVEHLRERGINLVVALRGDVSQDNLSPHGDFKHANQLVAYLKRHNQFSIAVAGYPEKHPEALSLEEDIVHLKAKVSAGADVIITQLFFDNAIFYRWVQLVRRAGITVPIVAGIMPIQKLNQVQKISQMCGAQIPQTLLANLQKHKGDDHAISEIGTAHAIQQCRDLIKNGVPGIHFFCLNKSDAVVKIVDACSNLR